MTTFGNRIKGLREAKELTQEDVAKALGTKQGSYTQLERGVSKNPSAKNLIALAHLYEVNPEWLLTGKGERHPVNTLTPEESELLLLYRDMSPEGQDYILRQTRTVHREEHSRPSRRDPDDDTPALPRKGDGPRGH